VEKIYPRFPNLPVCLILLPRRLVKRLAYLFCVVLSIAMIWYLVLSVFSCETCAAKPWAYLFILAFILIIAYAGFGLFNMLFPEKAESCPVCALLYRKQVD